MRVLLVSHRFPYPPTSGAKIRAYHIVEHLAREHEVTVAAPVRSREELEEGEGLSRIVARVVTEEIPRLGAALRTAGNLLTRSPSSMGYFHSPRLARRIRKEVAARPYDLVLAYSSSVAHYVAGLEGPTKILDFVDMDSEKWLAYAEARPFPLSLGYRLEGLKLRAAEAALARRFDLCTCATPEETATFRRYGTGVKADWFPNGVDVERFAPSGERYDPDTICFVGRMDYYPNAQCIVDFCATTLPLVRARRPGTKLLIVGAEPTPAVRRLARRIPGVTVTGAVSDVRPYLRSAALTVAPLAIARGTQNKILESLAMGVPCVASELAARGVDCVAGEHLLAASSPEGYAAAILRLLEDPAERERFAEAGRARMLSHHTWAGAMGRFDAILERTLAPGLVAVPEVRS